MTICCESLRRPLKCQVCFFEESQVPWPDPGGFNFWWTGFLGNLEAENHGWFLSISINVPSNYENQLGRGKASMSTYKMGVSENREHPIVPNGFADHDPVFKWLAISLGIFTQHFQTNQPI